MLRVADRELEHVPETPGAEVAEQEQPAAERAGHAGGEHAGARDQLVAELVEALDRRRRRRDALPAQRERLAAIGRPEDGRHLAARPVQVRLDDLEHEARRDGGVEGVAAALEHGHPGLRREPVRRRDHPEGAAQLGARREHARTLVFALVSPAHAAARKTPTARSSATRAADRSASPEGGEERRVVSVLFVDLVGFTSRAEKLDPEDVRAFLTPYYEQVRRAESFGGRVEKFIGDAVMGVFGAPTAYGDDAERAVRAALAVRDWAEEDERCRCASR